MGRNGDAIEREVDAIARRGVAIGREVAPIASRGLAIGCAVDATAPRVLPIVSDGVAFDIGEFPHAREVAPVRSVGRAIVSWDGPIPPEVCAFPRDAGSIDLGGVPCRVEVGAIRRHGGPFEPRVDPIALAVRAIRSLDSSDRYEKRGDRVFGGLSERGGVVCYCHLRRTTCTLFAGRP
jgi:hypothetical protein